MIRFKHQVVLTLFIMLFTTGLAAQNADTLWQTYLEEGPINNNLPDYSYAGFFTKASLNKPVMSTIFNVQDFGAIANDNIDDSDSIQKAIDTAALNGGGTVFLPTGRYLVKGGEVQRTLRIYSSNIILRGEGTNGDTATVLFLENPSSDKNIGVIGQVENDMRRMATIAIEGEPDNTVLASFASQDLLRGTAIIPVLDSSKLRPHQSIRIKLTDPLVDSESPNKEKAELVKILTAPFAFTGEETHTLGRHGKTVEYVTKIRRVIDDNHIELYQPLRFDHLSHHSPTIMAFGGLQNIGVEDLRLESAWPGQFVHHAPYPADAQGDDIIRSELEQDYGWVGIWGAWLSESWINNVVIDNYTQNLVLSNSAFIDVSNIVLEGSGGHAGLTYSSAHSILSKNIHFSGRYVHPLSIRAWTNGSVFTDITLSSDFYNPVDRTGPFIDFHGLYPYENLFENLVGFYVHSGGDENVMPHSGVRNTLWNIEAPEVIERFSYARREFFNTTVTQANKMYEYHPSSIVVAVHAKNGAQVRINRSEQDRVEPFIQVYGLNQKNPSVGSLFEAQVLNRQSNYPLPPSAPVWLVE
jgi:hypothetical protein